MSDSLVIAFGGNAMISTGKAATIEEQRGQIRHMSAQLGQLVATGHRVVVTHGNGPQVGEILLRSALASEVVPPSPLDVAGAMSQGQIGYLLQQEIGNYLGANGLRANVCSVVTQVLVEADDLAFRSPTKPIGRFYSAQQAAELRDQRGWQLVEDAGRGYRRVVPSPKPVSIIEWPAIRSLISEGFLVIAAGGGGIPVVRLADGTLCGVEAVIDKDLSAWRLANLVGARTLVLLTEVATVAVNFGTEQQRALEQVSMSEMQAWFDQGQFPAGSMGPKIRAALGFLEEGGERVIITSPSNLSRAVIDPTVGTQIVKNVVPQESDGSRVLRA